MRIPSISLSHYVEIFAMLVVACVLFVSPVHATVGGPTHIGDFKYNPLDESVYYISISESGRGCPPVLQKISLDTEKVDTVFSCDQGEALRGSDYASNDPKVMSEIQRITTGFKDLTSISLPGNKIQVDVRFIRTEELKDVPDYPFRSHFIADVYQDGVKIDEFPITGCNTEQPFTFAGYVIPGFEKKIALLSSTKSDCMEGGYTGEMLQVIGGIDSLNATHTGEYKSSSSPLIPSESTLVLFEKDEVMLAGTSTTPPVDDEGNLFVNGVFAVIVVVIAFLLGRLFLAKKK